MYQIVFEIPLKSWFGIFYDIPIHAYGLMLFAAFVFCTLLGVYLARKQGIAAENIHDLALWLFICGIIGARVTYIVQYWDQFQHVGQYFTIWDGGLVFYGSAFGGLAGYLGFYYLVMKPKKIAFWKLTDVIAPCAALGLSIGRIGCLLNGCCYGGAACVDCPQVSFPLPATPRYVMVDKGYQSTAGFTVDPEAQDARTVKTVEPGSAAANAGLQAGDVIVEAEGKIISSYADLVQLFYEWQKKRRGDNWLELTVQREDKDIELAAFAPMTIGLHPTQIYESISTALLVFLLLSFYPLRRHDGEVFLLFMIAYSVHRFINEILRIDTDPIAFGLTLSQNLSVLFLILGVGLGVWKLRQPPDYGPNAVRPEDTAPQPEPEPTEDPETALQE